MESEGWIFRVRETDGILVCKRWRTVSGQSPVGKWPHTDSSHGRVSCKQRRTTESEHKLDHDFKNSSRITLQNNNDTKRTHALKHRPNRWALLLFGTHNVSYLAEINEESPALDTVQKTKSIQILRQIKAFTLILVATSPHELTGTMCLHF